MFEASGGGLKAESGVTPPSMSRPVPTAATGFKLGHTVVGLSVVAVEGLCRLFLQDAVGHHGLQKPPVAVSHWSAHVPSRREDGDGWKLKVKKE